MPDLLRHVAHRNAVTGGMLLFSSGSPVLLFEDFVEGDRGGPRVRAATRTTNRPGGRVRVTADSAEAIRSLKASMGVPARPTEEPVDVWSRH